MLKVKLVRNFKDVEYFFNSMNDFIAFLDIRRDEINTIYYTRPIFGVEEENVVKALKCIKTFAKENGCKDSFAREANDNTINFKCGCLPHTEDSKDELNLLINNLKNICGEYNIVANVETSVIDAYTFKYYVEGYIYKYVNLY